MAENRRETFFRVDVGFEGATGYLLTGALVLGNIIFPWLVHTIPQGGLKFLPIYFFVLVGAYKFGLKVGLATAVISPLANSMITGMPPVPMLPAILFKGIALALIASHISARAKNLSLFSVVLAVFGYQAIGIAFETVYTGSVEKALSDVTIGLPGLAIQVFLGYLVLFALGEYKPKGAKIS